MCLALALSFLRQPLWKMDSMQPICINYNFFTFSQQNEQSHQHTYIVSIYNKVDYIA